MSVDRSPTATALPGTQDHRDHVRSPVDVLRLIIGVVLVVVGIGVANLFDSALLGLSRDGTTALEDLPSWARHLPATGLAVAVIAAAVVALGWVLITTRYRRFLLLTTGFLVAAGLSFLVGEAILSVIDDDVYDAMTSTSPIFRFRNGDGLIHPGDPLLAGAVAMLAVASSYLSRAVLARLTAFLAVYATASILSSGVPALGLVADVGIGITVASVILLIFGRHDLAPNGTEICEALERVGLRIRSVERLSVDARGSAPWVGHTSDGERVFIKALGRDERSADLMFRAYRWIRLRKTGDHRPFVSLRRAVEHEALVSLQAAALGIRTPRIMGVAEAGVDGMVLAYEAIDGQSADEVPDIAQESLVAIWEMVSRLHSRRIAHRDLRLANIFLDRENTPWLIDFGFSELAASEQLLGTDVAELLASTSALVGPERAVAAAHEATDLRELARAQPWLQPIALSAATRQAIGGDNGIEPIRTLLIEGCGLPREEPVKLERINGKFLFVLATIGLSAWFLLPQLADIDSIWSQVEQSSPEWAVAAVGFSLLSYVAATGSLLGAIPIRLAFAPALGAQIASSFANRVTPAKVGGVATNLRYFQKQGVATPVSVAAVGLNAVAGLIVHILLTVTFVFLSSNADTDTFSIPSTSTIVVALSVIVVTVLGSLAIPFVRRLVIEYVVPQLETGWESIQQISHSPGRLMMLFGGSAAITLSYLGAMATSLEAFGANVSFPVMAVLFLTATAVANAAPTPGGLGAAEAALIGAFSTIEDADIVIPAVFLYRFVTFWLPILPGWAALTWLRQTDRI